jgi:hypothetical protein
MFNEFLVMLTEPVWQLIFGGTGLWIVLDIYFHKRGWL